MSTGRSAIRRSLPALPSEWAWTPIGSCLTEANLRAKDVAHGTELPVLSLTKERGLIPQSDRFNHRVAIADVSNYKVVRPNWIVYNPMVIWEGAIWGLVGDAPGLVSPVYVIWKTQGVNWEFMDLLVRAPMVLAEYERLCSGVVRRRRTLKKSQFLSIEIPLPPVPEQLAIAHVLRTVQDAKEASEQVIAASRKLRNSLRQHLYTHGLNADDETVAFHLLGSLVRERLRNGKSAPPTNSESGTRTLTLSAVTENDFSVRNTKLTSADPTHGQNLWLRNGDIFVERANTRSLVGLAALYQGPPDFAIFPDLLIRVRPDEKRIDPKYLVEYLLTPAVRQYFSRNAQGTAGSMPKITQDHVAELSVPVPPIEVQRGIANALRAVDRKIAAEEARRDALATLFDSLLHDLLTARLRVTELIPEVA